MPLKAGISGTTHRFCSTAIVLGLPDCQGACLAMLGHLQNIQAHSFHEIMTVAQGMPGCSDYSPGEYTPFAPVGKDEMVKGAEAFVDKNPSFKGLGPNDKKNVQVKRLLDLIKE